MAVISGTGLAVASFFVGSTAAAALGAGTIFLIGAAAQIGLGLVLNALTPKPKVNGANRGYDVNSNAFGSALDHQIIYGENKVGGAVVYDSATGGDNKFLHRIIAFAGHEIDSFKEIYLDDELLTIDSSGNVTSPSRYNGKVRIVTRRGTDNQTAPQNLIDETASLEDGKWTSAHRLRGIAYIYVRFTFDQDAFPKGVPVVSTVIRGKKVFDPRTGVTAWSDNPALCIRDYLTNTSYGVGEEVANVDDAKVAIAADVCDHLNFPTLTGGKKFTCNGAFTTSVTPYDILGDLLTSMGGMLWYAQGKWRMKPAYYTAPVLSLNEDDLRSSVSLGTRHSRRDNYNTVKGTFKGEETNWQVTDYPEVTNSDFVVEDGGQPSVIDINLPFTSDSSIARRIALIALERNRQQLTVNASFGMRAFSVQTGDIIRLTNTRFGWFDKEFEVVMWTFGLVDEYDLQIQLTLREISESVFDDINDGVVYSRDNTTLPDPFSGLEINNLVATGGGRTQGDGTFINSAILSWNPAASSFVSFYEVEHRPLSDSSFASTTTSKNSIEISPLIDGVEYLFSVRAISLLGVRGPVTTVAFTGGGDVTAPALPTGITATGHFRYISLNWTNPADSDLSFVEVFENTANSTVGAVKVGISSGDTFQRTNLGLSQTRFYFLRAVDYSGNRSGFTSGVSATTTFLDDDDFSNGIYSLFTEQGLYAIEDVVVLPPSGAFVGQKVFNRTDGKLYQWTGAAWELVVAAVNAPDISGQLVTNQLAVNSITNSLIAANAITETKISDNAITTPKIAAGSVTAGEIAAGAVTAVKIAANSITSEKIVSGTIQAGDIAANTITGDKISGNTITGDKVVANTITGGLLATSGIITNSAQINNAVVTNAKIENGAITTAKIADAAITNAKIGNTIQSDNFSTGNSGWRILKNGSAEFNGPIISRPLQVDSGTVSVGNISAGNPSGFSIVQTFDVETTGVPISAWAGTNKSYIAAAGFSNLTVTAASGAPPDVFWGIEAIVLPLTRWESPQTLRLRLNLWAKRVSSFSATSGSTWSINWKIYEVA